MCKNKKNMVVVVAERCCGYALHLHCYFMLRNTARFEENLEIPDFHVSLPMQKGTIVSLETNLSIFETRISLHHYRTTVSVTPFI